MKEKNTCTKLKIVSVVLAVFSVILIIGSFFVPPTGIIDGTVLAAVGEIFGFAALFMTWEAIDRGIDTKITHGNTTIELNQDDEEKQQ